MFSLSKDPLPLSEACLHGMCVSLNAPVVYGDDLPPGPARAAIVTYAEDYGDFGMAVGMRALEDGTVAVYRYREPIVDPADIAAALEAAMIFAEGLGFLFDEDMIDANSRSGRREALEHWNRLMGDREVFAAGGVVEPPSAPLAEITLPGEGLDAPMEDLLALPESNGEPPAKSAGSELLLDELMDFADESPKDELLLESPPPVAPPIPARPAPAARRADSADDRATAAPDRPQLSKFRARPATAASSAPRRPAATRPVRELVEETRPDLPDGERAVTDSSEARNGAAALGRIPITRRRVVVEPERPGLLARLLASF